MNVNINTRFIHLKYVPTLKCQNGILTKFVHPRLFSVSYSISVYFVG